MTAETAEQRQLLQVAIVRLRSRVMAVTFGMVGGVGLFVATVWLLIRGGENVGQHLNLLDNYFPGYEVSWVGSLIGFGYGALFGGIIGWTLAWVYNRVADGRASR